MPRNMSRDTTRPTVPQNERNNYGGERRHRVEHNQYLEKNFTQDNQDYRPNGAQYNDRDEVRYTSNDRLAHDHHDRPERPRRYQDDEQYRPSNYSDGGHGREFSAAPEQQERRHENTDNRDYHMNKDHNRGAAEKYSHSEERYSQDRRESEDSRYPQDERYRQSDWAPQDRFNEIAPDRHRQAAQDRNQPLLNKDASREFDYHRGSDSTEDLEQEPRRRGRHYREY